jgi:uncharacterized membrane protein YvbJ
MEDVNMAFCTQCGTKLANGLKFCTKCGAKIGIQPFEQKPNPQQQQPNLQQEIIIHHTTKSEKNVATGFGRAFGETTGTATGCFVIIVVIIAVFLLTFVIGVLTH